MPKLSTSNSATSIPTKNGFFICGLTGGPFFPMPAIMANLDNIKPILIGVANSFESRLAVNQDLPILLLPVAKFTAISFDDKSFLDKVIIPFDVVKTILVLIFSCLKSIFYLIKYQPAIIYSTGSFLVVPMIYSAKILNWLDFTNCLIVVHQQDPKLGLSNSLTAKYSDIKSCVFEYTTQNYAKFKDAMVIPNPILPTRYNRDQKLNNRELDNFINRIDLDNEYDQYNNQNHQINTKETSKNQQSNNSKSINSNSEIVFQSNSNNSQSTKCYPELVSGSSPIDSSQSSTSKPISNSLKFFQTAQNQHTITQEILQPVPTILSQIQPTVIAQSFQTTQKPLFLIFGGGSGSVQINNWVADNLIELTNNFKIIHLTGTINSNKSKTNSQPQVADYYCTEALFEDMPIILSKANVVLCRAGLGSISELELLHSINLNRQSYLVALPHSHQELNAQLASNQDLRFKILDNQDTSSWLDIILNSDSIYSQPNQKNLTDSNEVLQRYYDLLNKEIDRLY